MKQIRTRDGSLEEFQLSKIRNAIEKAFIATELPYTVQAIELLAMQAAADAKEPTVEAVQHSVVAVLYKNNFNKVADAYSDYMNNHNYVRQIKEGVVDPGEIIEGQIAIDLSNLSEVEPDVGRKDNASTTTNLGALILNNSAEVTKRYWLDKVYDKPIRDAHESGSIHIHDLSMLSGYCAGWSLKQLIKEGLGGVEGQIDSSPAKHLSVLCNQMVNFLGIMQNEWAGAQAFSSVDTLLAPFVKADGLTYKETKQAIQSFVYGVNVPARWGTQPPFTNITLDWTVPDDLAELPAIVGGKEMDFKYKDCKKEMDMVNKAFLETMIKGDAKGRGFQYPIPTYSITNDFDWSATENNRLLFEMTAKYGTPYFSNYINSDMEPSDVRSMCCRLRLDLRELRKKSGGYFGSGESTGSIGVVTINMPRLAYLSKDEKEFYKRLDELMDIAARSIKIKRDIVSVLLERGLYPYTKRYLGNFNNHFSTIGLCGMNEAGLNAKWLKAGLEDEKVQKWTKEVLRHMRERLSDYQEEYGDLYNLEATPAESTMYRFARLDKEQYPDIITGGKAGDTPYYTNSSHLPVDYSTDIFDALDIQDELQTLYTSGTVFHAFLGEKLPDWKAASSLVRKIAENYRLPYYTLSPTYSICRTHGYLTGEHFTCPHCGKETEVYSRITGYYRPVKNWNDGKVQEYKNRTEYVIRSSQKEKREEEPSLLLFTTKSCPNCVQAKKVLDENHVSYKEIDAIENSTMTAKYHIMAAPCIVDTETETKYKNLSEIIDFVESRK